MTVQRLTNAEQSTGKVKTHMRDYKSKVEITVDAQLANITQTFRDVAPWHVIDPEDEDPDFFNEFTRVIDDAALAHADSDAACEVSTNPMEVGSDQYVVMEPALPRGNDGLMMYARVTKRLGDNEGIPVGTANDILLLDSRK